MIILTWTVNRKVVNKAYKIVGMEFPTESHIIVLILDICTMPFKPHIIRS